MCNPVYIYTFVFWYLINLCVCSLSNHFLFNVSLSSILERETSKSPFVGRLFVPLVSYPPAGISGTGSLTGSPESVVDWMMRMTDGNSGAGAGTGGENEWEVRPGGMLVQKRDPDGETNRVPPPTIRVRVKYGSVYHEINISSQATFGELKKMLSGPTGLHHDDQKLMYKDKVRDSKSYLDVVGVKDRSKMVVVEDPLSQERRLLELRKTAKMEKASKAISDISFEVDRLAGQVSAIESVISKGGKVAEKTLLNVIELLMNQLLKLDGITVDGDVKLQRKMQVKRVQGYVETLDALKVKNSTSSSNGGMPPGPPQSRRTVVADRPQQEAVRATTTTEWEIFDSLAAPTSTTTTKTTSTSNTTNPIFNWDLI